MGNGQIVSVGAIHELPHLLIAPFINRTIYDLPHLLIVPFMNRPVHITVHVGAIHELPLRMTKIQRRNMGLPKIIGHFKMLSSKQINILRKTPGTKIWQRNYWEYVVHDEI